MPVSPFQRAANEQQKKQQEQEQQQQDSGSGGGSKRKSRSRPTNARRGKKQKTKERYAKAREDAQLEGIIPTTPEGAVRDERTVCADPLDGLPEMVRQALKEKWDTPGAAKPAIIASLLRPFYSNGIPTMTRDGEVVMMPPSPKLLNELARTLLALDQTQYERDNPVQAGQAKGNNQATVAIGVSIEANKLAVQVMREAFERETGGSNTALPALAESDAPGYRRFDGQVETCAASTTDQRGDGESLVNTEQSDLSYGPIPAR